MIPDSVDPYAHLHKEDYSTAYNFPVLGHETLVFTQGRPAQSLNGEWYCTLDVFDEGLRQEWFIDTHRPEEQWDIPRDYEVEGGKIVTVPGCVNLYDARWDRYEGAMWFTRDFDCRPKKGERVFLKIGAAASQARIFLNEKFLGMHLGASTPFCVELSSLQEGMNRLQIQVDNTRRAEHVPMNHIDWFNYGGLYREVGLLRLPSVFIADFGAALVAKVLSEAPLRTLWQQELCAMQQRISGAIFDGSSGSGELYVPIDPKLTVRKAAAFAVTIEQPGGTWVSDMKRRVVIAAPKG